MRIYLFIILIIFAYSFQCQSDGWRWLDGFQFKTSYNGNYTTANFSPEPRARLNYGIAFDYNGGAFYIYGGTITDPFSNVTSALCDLWKFNMVTERWTMIYNNNNNGIIDIPVRYSITNISPGSRISPYLWTDGSNIWLYGGTDFKDAYYSDLMQYQINAVNPSWKMLAGPFNPSGPATYNTQGVYHADSYPGQRAGGCNWYNPSNKGLYLFGGIGNVTQPNPNSQVNTFGTLNDVWRFDTTQGAWTWLSGRSFIHGSYNISLGVPDARLNPICTKCSANGNVYLGFGQIQTDAFPVAQVADLWLWNDQTSRFVNIRPPRYNLLPSGNFQDTNDPNAFPGTRYTTSMTCDNSNNLWMIGGSFTRLDLVDRITRDIWKYDTSTDRWIFVAQPFDYRAQGNYSTKGFYGDAPVNNQRLMGGREQHISYTRACQLFVYGGYGQIRAPINQSVILGDMWTFYSDAFPISTDSTCNYCARGRGCVCGIYGIDCSCFTPSLIQRDMTCFQNTWTIQPKVLNNEPLLFLINATLDSYVFEGNLTLANNSVIIVGRGTVTVTGCLTLLGSTSVIINATLSGKGVANYVNYNCAEGEKPNFSSVVVNAPINTICDNYQVGQSQSGISSAFDINGKCKGLGTGEIIAIILIVISLVLSLTALIFLILKIRLAMGVVEFQEAANRSNDKIKSKNEEIRMKDL